MTQTVTYSALDSRFNYPNDVVSGKQPAGKLLIQACERHLRDLVDGGKRGLIFDADGANELARKFDKLPLPGKQARKRWNLLPWQHFVVTSLYGWKWKDTGERRYETIYLMTARGSGKTPLFAAMALYELIRKPKVNGILIGQTLDLTLEPFKLMIDIIQRGKFPILVRGGNHTPTEVVYGRGINASRLKRQSGNTKDGKGKSGITPSFIWLEENQELEKDAAFERYKSGFKDTKEPLVMIAGNAGTGMNIPAFREFEFAKSVLKNETEADRYLPLLYSIDLEDMPRDDESCWIKSNPSLPVAPPTNFIRKRIEDSAISADKWTEVERLNFSRWTTLESPSIMIDDWNDSEVKELSSKKERQKVDCFFALDLSRTGDLTSLAIGWDFDTRIEIEVLSFTQAANLKQRANESGLPYIDWSNTGELIVTPGKSVNYQIVIAQLAKYIKTYNAKVLAYDQWNMDEAIKELDKTDIKYHTEKYIMRDYHGIWLKSHPLGYAVGRPNPDKPLYPGQIKLWMPRSLKLFMNMLANQELVIKANGPLRVAACSLPTKTDEGGNTVPDRTAAMAAKIKIDPIVTAIMLVGTIISYREAIKHIPKDKETKLRLVKR